MNHDFSMTFNKPIRRLTNGNHSNDVRIAGRGSEMGFDSFAKDFLVTVATTAFSISTQFGAKEINSVKNVR